METFSALISIANKLDISVCKYYILNSLALNIHAYVIYFPVFKYVLLGIGIMRFS